MSVPNPQSAAAPPIRVLLVEDDAEEALLLRESLLERAESFRLEVVPRLADALARLTDGGVDVVVADLSLPDSRGLPTFEALYHHPRSVPILILSGSLDEQLALQTVRRGAQDYLVKGEIEGAMLARAIRYAVQRSAAERALASERNLLRNVVDNLVDAIYAKDREGRYLLGNLAHARQLGLANPEAVVGQHTRDLFPPETADRFLADDARVLEAGESILNRHEKVVDDLGQERWLSTTKVPLRGRDGEIIGLVGIGRDITARKQAEEQLARYTKELQEKNSELEEDLQMAREVQLAFLPQSFPSFPRSAAPEESMLRFCSRYIPATLLGGDFFHVLPISETAAGVLICDVMGHGVRAALVTAMHRALMEELTEFAAEPAAFLCQMNGALLSILRRTRSPMFASAFYLAIDTASGRIRYANAGHPRPVHLQRGTGRVGLLDLGGQRPGPALGIFEDSVFPVGECTVAAGDAIVLFTDGLYEVENAAGELYDQGMLIEAISQPSADGLDALFDRTIQEVRDFSATNNFADDVCLVGIEVRQVGAPGSFVASNTGTT